MDPDANLKEQEEILVAAAKGITCKSNRARLRELRAVLRDWLLDGGFHPDWDKYPTASGHYIKSKRRS